MNFSLELKKIILSHPVTSKQPPEIVQIHMRHPVHLAETAIRVGLLMGIVMMSTIILPASMMAVIAVDLMLILNIVMNVCVKVL